MKRTPADHPNGPTMTRHLMIPITPPLFPGHLNANVAFINATPPPEQSDGLNLCDCRHHASRLCLKTGQFKPPLRGRQLDM